jgi:hypothetical protein
MPGSGKTAQAVDAARCLEDSAHAYMMTSVPRPGKTMAAASSTGLIVFTRHPSKADPGACHAPSGVPLYELPANPPESVISGQKRVWFPCKCRFARRGRPRAAAWYASKWCTEIRRCIITRYGKQNGNSG